MYRRERRRTNNDPLQRVTEASPERRLSLNLERGRTASVISRQQRDVNRSPDPVLKLTAVVS